MTQYADDTEFIPDGSKKPTVRILTDFASMSGWNINYEKSQVIWIGSKIYCKYLYLAHLKLDWNPKVFTILEIKFSTNIKEISEINFENKLFEIKQVINRWMKRVITPLGRIAIIKSLLISKLNHLFFTLPNLQAFYLKYLNHIIFKFVWSNKPDRIKISIACIVCQGGLGMVDIYAYVKALKLMWIRTIIDPMQIFKWKNLLFSVYPDFNNIANFGHSYPVILMKRVNNSFWKECFDAFMSFAHNIHSSSFVEFLTEPIFYNPYIFIDKKPFYNSKWYQKGFSQITDVFNKNGKILSLKDIQVNFDIELSFVTYYGIVRSIRKYFSRLKRVQPDTFSLLDDTNVMRKVFAIKNGCKQYYYKLTNNTNIIKAESKWEELFHSDINWTTIYPKPFKTTSDTKLRWFQCRLLHIIITTNMFLLKMNKACYQIYANKRTLAAVRKTPQKSP